MQFNSSVLELYSNRTPFKNQPISFLLCDASCLKEQDDVSACLSLLNNPSVFALRRQKYVDSLCGVFDPLTPRFLQGKC